MMTPVEHLVENEKLVADGYVDLYEIELNNGTFLHLKSNNTVKWQGIEWQGVPIQFDGYSSSSAESLSRPKLQMVNQNGTFSTFVRDGLLIRAKFKRIRVLYQNILNDVNIRQEQVWIMWTPTVLNSKYIEFELRSPLDGPNFIVPARMYMPPEFPSVSL